MLESAVTAKGQTTLPKAVRASLGLKPGDRVRYVLMNGEVRLLKARPVKDLAGMLHRQGMVPVSLDEMESAIAAGASGEA